jgi:recombination protein RecT
MNHALIESQPGDLGFGCKCSQRFHTKKLAEAHVADQNLIEENEAKAAADRQADVHESKPESANSSESPESENQPVDAATATTEPSDEPKGTVTAPAAPESPEEAEKPQAPVAQPAADVKSVEVSTSTRSLPTSINSMDMADHMVLKYATTLINSDAAAEFQTRMKLIQRLNPKLASVTPQSLFMAMMACVHLRLMPNTTEQLAFIIPYGNEAQFQIGYKGLAELAYRTGNVVKIDQEAVFDGDEFEWSLGIDRKLVHKPNFHIDRTKYDKLVATYATAQMTDGSILFEVVTKAELDKIKAFAKAQKPDAPWNQWPVEQSKKTATKRLGKLLPKSSEDNRFKLAAEIDSIQEAGKRLVIDGETGEIFGEDPNAMSASLVADISEAQTTERLQEILRGLPMADQKKAAGAVTAKLRELAA